MAAALGGIDGLVFTGTVGERSSEIRRRVVQKLMFLGMSLDAKLNHSTVEPKKMVRISPASYPGRIYVVPADEDKIIAKHTTQILDQHQ